MNKKKRTYSDLVEDYAERILKLDPKSVLIGFELLEISDELRAETLKEFGPRMEADVLGTRFSGIIYELLKNLSK